MPRLPEAYIIGPAMGWREMSNILRLMIIAVILGFGLSACGIKGPLELPPEAKQAKPAPGPDGKKPHKPFVLDGLIR